jgi:membrane protein required for colicin V production
MPYAPLTFGTLVDVLAVMVLLFFLSRGLIRGVSDELARIMGFVGGAWAGVAFYPHIQAAFSALTGTTSSAAIAIMSLALTLLAGFITGLTVRCVFNAMFQVVILQPADAVLGLAAGAVYAAVILAVVFSLAMIVPLKPVQRLFTEQSRVGQQICPWLRAHMGLK